MNEDLKKYIRDIPDFPKPGILFRDITPLLADGAAFRQTVDRMADAFRGKVDMVLESVAASSSARRLRTL
jgi:adenine phosphoribosyltransferase